MWPEPGKEPMHRKECLAGYNVIMAGEGGEDDTDYPFGLLAACSTAGKSRRF